MSSYNHFGCSCCGGPFNGGNSPGCSSVGSGNEFVYNPNPYSYNDTPNFFNQPPQHQYETYSYEFCGGNPHPGFDCQTGNTPVFDQGPCYNQNYSDDQPSFYSSYQQQQFDCCEVCEGPHYSSDCQTRNQLVYEPNPSNNYDFPYFDQPPQYHIDQSPPQDLILDSLMCTCRENNRILEEMLRTQMPNSPVVLNEPEGSDDYTKVTYDKEQCLSDHYTAHVTPPAYTPFIPFLATMEPTDTLLMGDEVISTIPARETNEFIKSSVDDFVLIPKESEVTSDSVLECNMPTTTPLPPTDNGEADFDINSPLGEYVVDFLMENEVVAGLPRHLVKYLFNHLLKNLSLTKGMSDEPFGDDTKPRSFDVTFSNPLFDFNDDFTLCNDNPLFEEEFEDINIALPLGEHLDTLSTGDREIDFNPSNSDSMYYDSESDILFFEQLLNEDSFSDESSALLPIESSLLVPPLPGPKHICLGEVERFDPFFSLTQSGGKTRDCPDFEASRAHGFVLRSL
ncbi:hypothetical protein Tco_1358847 [Tanacetum coccineum]